MKNRNKERTQDALKQLQLGRQPSASLSERHAARIIRAAQRVARAWAGLPVNATASDAMCATCDPIDRLTEVMGEGDDR